MIADVRRRYGWRADSAYEHLARAVVADKAAPPVLLLAAWHYLYGWRTDDLPELVAEAP